MFDSISKVWSEVTEESSASVHFSPHRRKPSSERNHYMQYDRPAQTAFNRLKRSSAASSGTAGIRRGSPRILKPSTDQKKNTFWGTLGKIITGGGEQKDVELGNMKNYMSGMIRKRPREMPTSRMNGREQRDAADLRSRPRTLNELQSIAASVNERADEFTRESPKHKRVRRLRAGDLESNSSCNDSISDFITKRHNIPIPKYSSTPKEPKKRTSYTNQRIRINDLPSSPFAQVVQSKCSNISRDNGSANFDDSSEKIKELTSKVDYLETTIQSLRDELRSTTERSMQLEQSFRQNSDPLISQTPAPVAKARRILLESDNSDEEDSLSPVKLDLNKFKLIQ